MLDNPSWRGDVIRHAVQPVPASEVCIVDLFIGHTRRSVSVERPIHYEHLSLVSRLAKATRAGGFGRFQRIREIYAAKAPALRLGHYLDTRYYEPNNVAHLLQHLVPLCLTAREAVADVKFVFRPLLPRFLELLAHFGIEPICTNRPIVGHQLRAWLSRGLAQFPLEQNLAYPPLGYMPQAYDGFTKPSGSERIFLSRKGERSLTNEREVIALLWSKGYRTVYLEQRSIAEQIAIVQAAEHIVAVHGAAMGFLALKDRIGSVVELMPPNIYTDHFPMLVGHKADRYAQLIPSFDESVHFTDWATLLRFKQQPFAADLEQLGQAL